MAIWQCIASVAEKGISPEGVDGRQGLIRFINVSGSVERAKIQAWVRAFEDEEMNRFLDLLDSHRQTVHLADDRSKNSILPKCTMEIDTASFNTRQWFDENGWLPVNLAGKAMYVGGIPPWGSLNSCSTGGVSTPVRLGESQLLLGAILMLAPSQSTLISQQSMYIAHGMLHMVQWSGQVYMK
eukprot:jgi/Picsp_1/4212/NSC_01721-R1_peptidase t